MYYVPGFSNYLNGLVPNEELLSEDMPAYDAPVYYTPPRPQPVAAEPYYAEPSYSLPTAQPVAAEPYYEAPSYSLPTAQPVAAEPFLGGLSAPTLSEQPVSEAPQPWMTDPALSGVNWDQAAAGMDEWLKNALAQNAATQAKLNDPTYIAAQKAKEEWLKQQYQQGNYYTELTDPLSNIGFMNLPGSTLQPDFDPNNPTANMQQIFYFDNGVRGSSPDPYTGKMVERNSHPLPYIPGITTTMYDSKGNVLGTASTPAEMQKLAELSNTVSEYKIRQSGDPTGPGAMYYGQGMLPEKTNYGGLGSLLVQLGALALPAVGGAVLGPVLAGSLGTSAAVGTGLGTAIGSAASGVTAGKSIGDILKQAAIAGVTAGGLQALAGGPTAAAGGNANSGFVDDLVSMGVSPTTAANIAGGLGGALPTDIVVTGTGGTGALSGFGGTLANIPSAALTTGPEPRRPDYGDKVEDTQQPVEDQIVVTGTKAPIMPTPGLPSVAAPFVPGALDAVAPPSETIVAEGVRKPEVAAPVPVPAFTPGALDAVAPPSDEIVVSKRNEPVISPGIAASTIASAAPSLNAPTTPAETTPAPKEKTTLEKVQDIADYMQLAGLGVGALGSLFGGGQQTAAKIANASGLGGLNPTFSAKLPGANIPGLGGITVGGGPRTAADLGQQGMTSPQDYYRYGYGPEQSFFGYVPQGAPNTSQAYTGYAKGGFAVEGPGDGREDKIPAMLSDGEYVIDAETVALLGNGSNKAGADMLDQFRVKVRKHKGRELARGKFSKNAKRPEQYLGGGRA